MHDEFIVKHGGVLLDLDDVDGHSGHFRDDDASERVRDVQLGVGKLKGELVL